MRFLQHPTYQQISIVDVLYALGDPVRLEIVRRLAIDGEQPCACLCAGVDANIAKSTMSHHFRILRAAGVVFTRKEGTQLLNSLRREDLDMLFPGLLDIAIGAVNAPTRVTTSN
jgi:DNA-binding transcriptional ArsR family regulator